MINENGFHWLDIELFPPNVAASEEAEGDGLTGS